MGKNAIEQLRSDFKRVYIEQWGIDGWNKAIKEGTLPDWLGFNASDLNNKTRSEQ